MYTVLARKYRSTDFDELVGQEHIAKTLKRAIESGRIAHAYLFCGTRGTGKTSTARILAKALNCLKFDAPTPNPCGKCDSCTAIARGDDIDVIEIDAASNTGVDNVREIIENASYRPARSRFKVYIIDEVHMLSKSAFNALLKILEEPPSHVKFILATTEPEKVLPTILSRCQRYDFRNISSKEIASHLKEICKKEKISTDDDALALVAKAGAGSMRDALSLLDRLLSLGDKKLAAKDVEQILGLPKAQLIYELVESIGSGEIKETLERAGNLISSGLSPDSLVTAISEHLRNLLIALTCGNDSELLDLPGLSDSDLAAQAAKFDAAALAQDIAILEELRRNMRQSQTGRAMLDAALVRIALADQFSSIDQLLAGGATADKPRTAPAPPRDQKKKPEPEPVAVEEPVAAPEPLISTPPQPVMREVAEHDLWPRLLALPQTQTPASFASILRLARFAGIEDEQAILRFPHSHETFVKQWSSNGKRDIIAAALTELRGQPTGVKFEIDADPDTQAPATPSAPAPRPAITDTGPIVEFVLQEFGGTLTRVE
jgi:DNA polymerase-3 subunit gamma/tau